MKRLYIVALLAVIAAGVVRGQQGTGAQASPGAQFEAAIKKEVVDGDLKTAIEMYRKLAQASDRGVAAKALMRMGQCYEKLGDAQAREARRAYEQVVREFSDQAEAAAEARARLGALAGTAGAARGSTMAVRRVWTGPDVDGLGQVSPDGRFLSFTDWETGDLAIHDLTTGENRRITRKGTWVASSEYAEFSLVSPDGRQIAYNWYNKDGFYDLRIVGIDGVKPRVVYSDRAHLSYIWPIAWSPDSMHILTYFSKTDGPTELMLVRPADGSARLITASGKDAQRAVFSPDGRYLAYALRENISLFDVATAREFPLIPDPSNHSVMGWAPDGKHILFSSERSGSPDAWLIAVADGKAEGEPTLVKKDFSGSSLGFARSGAFYYAVENTVGDVQIAELDPASGKVVSPPQPASRRWVGITRAPDWSPDGRSLAYIRSREPSQAVIIVRSMDTGEERELQVGERRLGADLRWAPDGKAIVVPGFEPGKKTSHIEAYGGRKSLTRIDVQTGQVTSLMPFPVNVGGSPPFDLSPDGKTVFYINLNLLSDGSHGRNQLLVRDVRSGQETELIEKKELNSVSVAPDGKRLVIGAREDRSQVLLVMPAAGGEARELVRIDDEEANRVLPSWTPDGRYVVFRKNLRETAKRPPRVQVWRVAAEGGVPQPTELTVDGLSGLRLHPDGRRIAIGTRKFSREVWVMENFLPVAKGTPADAAQKIKK